MLWVKASPPVSKTGGNSFVHFTTYTHDIMTLPIFAHLSLDRCFLYLNWFLVNRLTIFKYFVRHLYISSGKLNNFDTFNTSVFGICRNLDTSLMFWVIQVGFNSGDAHLAKL
jgi:hypothetical protein